MGRVQWDPARDLFGASEGLPREIPRRRAIQIGLKGKLSQKYVNSIVAIQDVTDLAHRVAIHHQNGSSAEAMRREMPDLPTEQIYNHELLGEETCLKLTIKSE